MAAAYMGGLRGGLCLAQGGYVDKLAAFFADGELHGAVYESVEGVVAADAYVEAGVMLCAALALDDVAGLADLSAEDLDAQAFAF